MRKFLWPADEGKSQHKFTSFVHAVVFCCGFFLLTSCHWISALLGSSWRYNLRTPHKCLILFWKASVISTNSCLLFWNKPEKKKKKFVGTIFSGRLNHIWCFGECLWQQSAKVNYCVCVCVCVHGNKGTLTCFLEREKKFWKMTACSCWQRNLENFETREKKVPLSNTESACDGSNMDVWLICTCCLFIFWSDCDVGEVCLQGSCRELFVSCRKSKSTLTF